MLVITSRRRRRPVLASPRLHPRARCPRSWGPRGQSRRPMCSRRATCATPDQSRQNPVRPTSAVRLLRGSRPAPHSSRRGPRRRQLLPATAQPAEGHGEHHEDDDHRHGQIHDPAGHGERQGEIGDPSEQQLPQPGRGPLEGSQHGSDGFSDRREQGREELPHRSQQLVEPVLDRLHERIDRRDHWADPLPHPCLDGVQETAEQRADAEQRDEVAGSLREGREQCVPGRLRGPLLITQGRRAARRRHQQGAFEPVAHVDLAGTPETGSAHHDRLGIRETALLAAAAHRAPDIGERVADREPQVVSIGIGIGTRSSSSAPSTRSTFSASPDFPAFFRAFSSATGSCSTPSMSTVKRESRKRCCTRTT